MQFVMTVTDSESQTLVLPITSQCPCLAVSCQLMVLSTVTNQMQRSGDLVKKST